MSKNKVVLVKNNGADVCVGVGGASYPIENTSLTLDQYQLTGCSVYDKEDGGSREQAYRDNFELAKWAYENQEFDSIERN